jgi:hypothetical protein
MLMPNQETPTINLMITLSRPLIPAVVLQSGLFAQISVDDARPVPDEWSLREGNEKDLQSSKFRLSRYLSLQHNFSYPYRER